MDKFKPSKAKKIKFGDGKVLELNRRQRRRLKLYNRVLRPVKESEDEGNLGRKGGFSLSGMPGDKLSSELQRGGAGPVQTE